MKKAVLLIMVAIMAVSCASQRKITYFQGVDPSVSGASAGRYEVKIRPDDNLHISVSAINPEAAAIFNLINTALPPQHVETLKVNSYLVDQDGYVNFPVIGPVKLAGLTRTEATTELESRIATYLEDPTVNIRFLNFKVTVLGEVAHPGTYSVGSERVTLLEALGMAGDLTIYGKRSNVLVYRENDGEGEFSRVDLTSPDVFASDCFYLQQNDLVYVQPNRARAGSASYNNNLSLGVSLLSLFASLALLIF